ncbi:MAG: hypothetical protein NTY53_22210, partial [Kiritimatiellaeota bacterium]|nr:hypothetical protein [Kiritimatiellota bacterium]
HEKTIEVEDQRDLVEKAANKAGDKIIGCFGKDSPEGKLVAGLRASTRFKGRPAKPADTPTPPSP